LARDWSTAVPDWENRIRAGQSLLPDLPLYADAGDRAVAIFKRLRAPDIIGTPRLGDIAEPWVIDFVRAIFGCYDPETKRRMIQEFFLMVPKKNYKSGIASAIMLTAMIVNERPNAELVLVSETQKISGIAFRNVRGMIKIDGALDDLFHIVDHQKKVVHLTTNAELQVVSADGDVVTGSKASFVLVDEAHVLGMKQKAAAVYLELRGGLASRPEGFFLQITTQSKVPPGGQFRKELERARAARDGRSSAGVLAVIYEFPADILESEGWRDEATWKMVNPNYGLSIDHEYLRQRFEEAREDGPEALALFASQHLNVEIGGFGFGDGWAAQRYLKDAVEGGLTLEALIDRSEVVTIGIDGGGDDDLCGLYIIGREAETRNWLGWGHVWCQRGVLQIRKSIAPKLIDFAADGDLTICDGEYQHVEEVVALCLQVAASGKLPEVSGIGLDHAGLPELFESLIEVGLSEPLIVGVPQGTRLAPAIQSVPLRLKAGLFAPSAQNVIGWAIGNAKVELSTKNPMITKKLAGAAKIDPVIALLNAAMLMHANPQAKPMIDYDSFLDAPVMVT